jgi:hypothetical protein
MGKRRLKKLTNRFGPVLTNDFWAKWDKWLRETENLAKQLDLLFANDLDKKKKKTLDKVVKNV